LYQQAFEKFKKAVDYGGDPYNLACLYALKEEKENALSLLETSLSNKIIALDFVEKDGDWRNFQNDPDFINILNKYR